jgi:hypothetical protein
MLYALCLVLAASLGNAAGPQLPATLGNAAPHLHTGVAHHSLDEPEVAIVLAETDDIDPLETLVYDPNNGGVSHIKVSSSSIQVELVPAYSYSAAVKVAVKATMAALHESQKVMCAAADTLQSALCELDPQARIDRETPADGHCLFHGLRRGGLGDLGDIQLSVAELRSMAVNMATQEQIEIAAISAHMSVEDYTAGMSRGEWGDNLVLATLAASFKTSITVVSQNSARTFYGTGGEQQGVCQDPHTVWIAHYAEWHYFGIIRSDSEPVEDAPVHEAVPCGLCSFGLVCPDHPAPLKKRRLNGKCPRPPSFSPPVAQEQPTCKPSKNTTNAKKNPQKPSKKAAPANTAGDEGRRICGNCGVRGHQAVTCVEPCFACQGKHQYFECDHPDLYHDALRQANRNRVQWQGFGAQDHNKKSKSGMKESGTGKYWVRQHYDPEYAPERDRSPKRVYLDTHGHPSDRCKISLRTLWDQTEPMAMEALIDGGFLSDICLDKGGDPVPCKGILMVHYYSKDDRHDRKLHCHGVPEKQRHRQHWLAGSPFQGHYRLDALDVCGVLQSFGAGKSVEIASQDTGLYRGTVRVLYDRLRMVATLVAQDHREHLGCV